MTTETKATVTVAEFKMWLQTIEEFTGEGDDWYPTEAQWRKIREKIKQLEEMSLSEAIEAIRAEVEKLKVIASQPTPIAPQYTTTPAPVHNNVAAQPVAHPTGSALDLGAPALDEPPASGKMAPSVTMPPAVQQGQAGPDGQPAIKVPPRYDETGNYKSSFE